MKNVLLFLVNSLSIALLIVSVAAYFSSLSQALELISHMRLIFAVVGLILLLATLPLKNALAIALAASALLSNIAAIAVLYLPAPPMNKLSANADDVHRIKIMQFNLWGGKNKKYFAVVQQIIETNPDVIGFSEVTPIWVTALKAGLANYPYMVADTTGGGIAIFSRIPLESKEIRFFSRLKRPRAIVKIKLASGHFTMIMAHPFIPMKEWPLRNDEFSIYAKEAVEASSSGPVVLAGDLNCTPWSSYFTKLLTDSKLVDTEQGFGPQPSWSTFHKVAMLPIDHCLVSKDIKTVRRYTGAEVGSDHLPVVVELEMRTGK
ncbi:MAG: endonuclease/exonuclease/phosphatase family protein [Candidatus Obscuribacterales bacterium]